MDEAVQHGWRIRDFIEDRQEAFRAGRERTMLRLSVERDASALRDHQASMGRQNIAEQMTGVENAIRAVGVLPLVEVARMVNNALDAICLEIAKSPAAMTDDLRARARVAAESLEAIGGMDASFRTRWKQVFGVVS